MLFVIEHMLPCLFAALLLGGAMGYLLRRLWREAIAAARVPVPLPDFRIFARVSDIPDVSKFALKSEVPTGELLEPADLAPLLAWKEEVGDPKLYARRGAIDSLLEQKDRLIAELRQQLSQEVSRRSGEIERLEALIRELREKIASVEQAQRLQDEKDPREIRPAAFKEAS